MKRIYILSLFFLPLFFSSCNTLVSIGIGGLVVIFGLMFILFAIMFFLIAKRKKKGERSLAKFNNDIALSLSKLGSFEQKIVMLETLIDRINKDEIYKKDTEWRDKVLAKTYMHLATTYYKMGNEGQTLQACSKIIELDDSDGMTYYNRGSIYSNMGMYDKALQDLNKTLELMPKYASAFNNRGLVHEKMEHYTEAINDFTKAIELEESPIAYYNRGNTHFELQEFVKAIEDYESATAKLSADEQEELKQEISSAIHLAKSKLKKE